MANESTPTGTTAPLGTATTPTAESSISGTGTGAGTGAGTGTGPGVAGGAPARVYMNEKIVPYLLEGMKSVAREQPPNPLRVLGEYLIQKSSEVEGGQGHGQGQGQGEQGGKAPE